VNETGQQVVSDMQQTLNSATVEQAAYLEDAAPHTGGRLCANNTVYAWNYRANLTNNPYNVFDTATSREIRLVKFQGTIEYCQQPLNTAKLAIPTTATDLIKPGDSNLAVQSFSINMNAGKPGQPVTGDDTQRIYQISVVIGSDGVINASDCEVPKSTVDDEYCAVNQFTFTARAGNRSAE
jgi:hypothetical protein